MTIGDSVRRILAEELELEEIDNKQRLLGELVKYRIDYANLCLAVEEKTGIRLSPDKMLAIQKGTVGDFVHEVTEAHKEGRNAR